MSDKVGRFVQLLATALLTGSCFFVATGLIPILDSLPAAEFVGLMQRSIRPYTFLFMSMAIPATMTTLVYLAVNRNQRSAPWWLNLVALGCLAGGGLITTQGNFPINDAIRAWSASSPPSDWATYKDAWIQLHYIRTGLAVLALACCLGAVCWQLPVRRIAHQASMSKLPA